MQQVQNLIEPRPVPPPIDLAPWFVVLTEPQQDLRAVDRLHRHALNLELFVPVVRNRVKTGRVGKNGHKVTRVVAKPMFPGYGFLRCIPGTDPESLIWRDQHGSGVRGVREFMRNERREFVTLPHAAVLAVFRRQILEQQEWIAKQGGRKGSHWKVNDIVRIDADGGAYAGLIATIEKIPSKDRIQVLLGAAGIRHTLPADMVVAA